MSKVDKTMNLDDLIDKFKDYCQGEGDYVRYSLGFD